MPSAASTSAMALKWLTLKPGYSKPTATFERLRSFVRCRLPAEKTGPRLVLRLPPVSPEESHPGQVNGSMKRAGAEAIEGAPELYPEKLAERIYRAMAAAQKR
jgi:hypothetical protein